MASLSTRTMHFDCTPELLLEVITAPDFHKANLENQGNPKATIHERSRTDDKLVFDAEVEEYAKGVRGIDKSKIEVTWTNFIWDLEKRTAQWNYRGPHARAKVYGDIRIVGSGERSTLTENFHVNIKIPLVGKGIEKIVIRETEAYWPKYEVLINEFIQKMSG